MQIPETTATSGRSWRLIGAVAIAALALVLGETTAATAAPSAKLPAAVDGPVSVSISAPTKVAYNGTATITVTTEGGHDGTATLYTRSSTGEWAVWGSAITMTDGAGSTQVSLTSSRAFRVVADVGGTSRIFTISMQDTSKRAITAVFNYGNIASGELAWIRGTAYKSSATTASATVIIQRAAIGSSTWTQHGTTKTSSSGVYSYRLNPSPNFRYRAVISGTAARSGPVTVEAAGSDRTLEQRAVALSSVIGAASGAIQNVDSGNLPSGVESARYRLYAKGVLVEVTRSSGTQTWWVYDRIGTSYASANRWEGKLGLPMRDAKCGLLEGGCVQRFTGGAVYQNTNKSGAFVAYATVPESELIAVAISQANYTETEWRKNKFNSWVGGNAAWCSVFQSWVGAASGNSSWVPKRSTYDGFVSALVASGKLHYSGTPPIGSIVLYDWQTGNPTHSGLVRGKSGAYLYTVEGNTSNGKGSPVRGVWLRSRAIADVWAWYTPHELPN